MSEIYLFGQCCERQGVENAVLKNNGIFNVFVKYRIIGLDGVVKVRVELLVGKVLHDNFLIAEFDDLVGGR